MSATKICPQCNTEYPEEQRFCPRDGSTLKLQSGTGDLVGSVIADRYHVTRKLGEGGMGQVYLAEHVRMGRKSAVKVMNPAMVNDADAISRFNREAANASRISHPHVAAIYDFGETADGLIYLAMEFIEGEPLTKLVERLGALPAPRAADIARQAADALAVAHDMGIVHRDLKPDNIMIARNRDGSDCVKVVDFGIAKAADSAAQKVTKTGLVVGTPEYMSPEQLAGDRLDGRSDIYSLALVTFNMLTGKLPFPADTVQESMIMRLTDRPRTLAEMRPDVAWPAELQAVLDRALARDLTARYASASDFGRDLTRAVAQMPATRAAELGTAVLDAVPPTRVAPTPESTPVTRAVEAPPREVAPVAGSSRRGLPMALVGGGILAVVAIGGGMLYANRESPARADSVTIGTAQPSDSMTASSPVHDTTSPLPGPTLATGPRTAATGAPNAARPAGGPSGTTAREAGTATSPAAPAFNATAALDEIDRLVQSLDKDKARRAIDKIDALLPRLSNRADSTQALFEKASAYGLIDDDTRRTCAILERLRSQTPPVRFTASVVEMYQQACQ